MRDVENLIDLQMPSNRRRFGGPNGIAGWLVCNWSASSSSAQSSQTSNNNQAVGGNVATGGFSSVTGAQGSTTINVTNADAAVAQNAIGNNTTTALNAIGFGAETSANAIAAVNNTANNALAANTTTTANALGFGAENLNQTLNFAGNAVNTVAQVAAAGQAEAQNANAAGNQTVQMLSTDLAAITANAAPQTPSAANEILNGTSPLAGAQTSAANNWVEYAVIGGFVLAAFAFFKTGGKSS